jgi:hypothetical protein
MISHCFQGFFDNAQVKLPKGPALGIRQDARDGQCPVLVPGRRRRGYRRRRRHTRKLTNGPAPGLAIRRCSAGPRPGRPDRIEFSGKSRSRSAAQARASPFSTCSFKELTMTLPKATTPFVVGVVAGAFVISLLGFANGWIVTADAKDIEVKNASINAQAAVCASLAEAHIKATKDTTSLYGYQSDARKARDDLAREFAVALPGDKTADSIVVTACAHMLNKPSV